MERFDRVEQEFECLSDCVRFAQAENQAGRYLFRGERTDRHKSTWPMASRVARDLNLPPRVRSDLRQIVERLHADLQEFLDLDEDLALGFIQHYEAPTQLLDLTSCLDVAACFASGKEEEGWGLMALVPKSIATLGSLIDLTQHPKANRPRRQYGHVLKSQVELDLKSQAAITDHGVRWLRFKHRDAEHASRIGRCKALLDVHDDEMAGVLQLLLDSYGKWVDWTAEWLANHVVAAPFVAKLVGRDADGGLIVAPVPIQKAAVFDQLAGRENNRRIWSNMHFERRGEGGFVDLVFLEPPGSR